MNCEHCQHQPLKSNQKRFCSHDCRDASMRQTADRVCAHAPCGRTFTLPQWQVNRGRGVYCSPACRNAAKLGQPRPDLYRRVERTCVACGTTFETGGRAGASSRRYCSDDCRNQARYRSGRHAKELHPIDAAYLAGFIDGEGSIILYMPHQHTRAVSVKLAAANNHRAVLDWMVEVTGVGAVTRHYRRSEKHAEAWFYQANSEAAESIIKQIRPYLRIKQQQADLALETQARLRTPALKADRAWQEAYRARMQHLNRRGPRADSLPI